MTREEAFSLVPVIEFASTSDIAWRATERYGGGNEVSRGSVIKHLVGLLEARRIECAFAYIDDRRQATWRRARRG